MTDDYSVAATQKQPNRILGVSLAVLAAACLIYAAVTHRWLFNSTSSEEFGFGLTSNFACQQAATVECASMSNGKLMEQLRDDSPRAAEETSAAFVPTGWATLVECLLAALGLLGAAGIAIAKRTPTLPLTPSTLALLGIMAGLITGCVFVATKPGPAGYVGVGPSFWVFGAGAVLGIAGAQLLARVNRPVDPDLMHDAMNPDEF